MRTIKAAAPSFGVEVFPAGIHEAGDIVGTIEAFAREADGGLIVLPSPPATMHRDLIVTLAARHRLPAIYPLRYYRRRLNFLRAKYGRPISARGYIDRILKCEKAADLPVQIQGCKS